VKWNPSATRRKPDLLQPQLPYRNLDAIVHEVSAQYFQLAFDDVAWCFVLQPTLACISAALRRIRIHNILDATYVAYRHDSALSAESEPMSHKVIDRAFEFHLRRT
jgi:hypothetical protein